MLPGGEREEMAKTARRALGLGDAPVGEPFGGRSSPSGGSETER
jgi:hypothetical protein